MQRARDGRPHKVMPERASSIADAALPEVVKGA
jgi:hypothetical protein